MEAEDEGMRFRYFEKRCLLAEDRAEEAEREAEAEELVSNLKLRAEADGEFVRKLASGRRK